MTEQLSYENGVEVGYERGLKAAQEDSDILASYSWSQGYNAALDAAREAVAALLADEGDACYRGCLVDAIAIIDALRGESK